jgi:hypothetical protein
MKYYKMDNNEINNNILVIVAIKLIKDEYK